MDDLTADGTLSENYEKEREIGRDSHCSNKTPDFSEIHIPIDQGPSLLLDSF